MTSSAPSSDTTPLFRQVRVGKDGRHFTVFKFRTMVADAEERKAQLDTLNENAGCCSRAGRIPGLRSSGRSCAGGHLMSCRS